MLGLCRCRPTVTSYFGRHVIGEILFPVAQRVVLTFTAVRGDFVPTWRAVFVEELSCLLYCTFGTALLDATRNSRSTMGKTVISSNQDYFSGSESFCLVFLFALPMREMGKVAFIDSICRFAGLSSYPFPELTPIWTARFVTNHDNLPGTKVPFTFHASRSMLSAGASSPALSHFFHEA